METIRGTFNLGENMMKSSNDRDIYTSSSLMKPRTTLVVIKAKHIQKAVSGMSKPPSAYRTPTRRNSEFYVCPTFIGRLGNQLFQFASGFGIAASKDMKFLVSTNDLIFQIFQLKNSRHLFISEDRERECVNAQVTIENRASSFDKNVGNFATNATHQVGYYLQSWKYFHNSSHELRKQLKFRDHVQTLAKKIIKDILEKYKTTRDNVTLIAIHIRRGDMVNHTYGYLVASKEYFEKAMILFSNYSNPIYVLCSNDLKWSRANIMKKYKVEFISGNSPEVDLALMASCDHVISSVGSFSWWAGWLSNGKVTYFKWPAKEGSDLRAEFSSDYMDYFYPHWTGL
ncbi:galactoside alpha-(1,2)-fucosyltransferase 2-like [Saccostrea echinata]|uniref:galactoside alpha-(1,2)-fucosyltransferase 2-like n=1 Tax=Saccostrea echinata TaxID=191078 RepID=UPI002A7F8A2E|nr:galactoside alpha-(1,2)-fucosyltransferase 2-like [Saccostrea echinata]